MPPRATHPSGTTSGGRRRWRSRPTRRHRHESRAPEVGPSGPSCRLLRRCSVPCARCPRLCSSIGALAEPTRLALTRYVAGSPPPVSREQAAAAVDLPLHPVEFHLDRLVEEGPLEVQYRRLTGRTGPGAGRPSKLYRRAQRQVLSPSVRACPVRSSTRAPTQRSSCSSLRGRNGGTQRRTGPRGT